LSGVSTTFGGVPIPDFLNGGQYGELDVQRTSSNAYGAAVQVTDTHDVFGLKNHFLAGFAFDGARTQFNAASYVGALAANTRILGPSTVIVEPGQNIPVSVGITNATYGVYFADSLNLTDRLTATVSGRFNAAVVDSTDFNGGDLSGSHSFTHFNPAGGLTYELTPWLTVYGGYAMANRAPTPAELGCPRPPTPAAWLTPSSRPRSAPGGRPDFEASCGQPKWARTRTCASLGFFRPISTTILPW
jgi:outer membrane receptor protein involved in Fe transport